MTPFLTVALLLVLPGGPGAPVRAEEGGAASAGEQAAAAEGQEATGEEGAASSDEMELQGEGEEEAPAEETPRPRPKPKPKPKPSPKPVAAKSPFDYRVLEDFETSVAAGAGAVKRSGVDPRPQFSARVATPGADGGKCLVFSGVTALAETTAWSWSPGGQPANLAAWRGISVRAKASKPTVELRFAVLGGAGAVYTSSVLGTDWGEVRLDFSRDPGRGRFDPARVSEILVTAVHELAEPVDVSVDTLAAWRERVPSEALRLGLNVPPLPGLFDLGARFETVNCVGRASAQEGLRLAYWSGPLPYQHWTSSASWRDLPRGLKGARSLVAHVKAEPATPPVLLKFTLVEEQGERFAATRPIPADGGLLTIRLDEFAPDALANLREPRAEADGRLDPAAVKAWSLEVLPATERQYKGTIELRELWAQGAEAPPPPKEIPKPKPKPRPKPKKTVPAPEEQQEEEEGGGDMELSQ